MRTLSQMVQLEIRPLRETDYNVLLLLEQLTVVGDTSRAAFSQRVLEMSSGPEHVFVVEGAKPELRRSHVDSDTQTEWTGHCWRLERCCLSGS